MISLKDIHKLDDEDLIKSIYIPFNSYPEFIKGSLESLFEFTNMNQSSLSVYLLKNNHCLIFTPNYHDTIKSSNIIATNIYRDYTHDYFINEVIYGPALLMGYNPDLIQNNDRFLSVSDVYMNEIINRFNTL